MLEWITGVLDSLSYGGIVLLMFLENIFPPIPSGLVMPLAGFTASQGKLAFVLIVLAGILGSVLGALPWYFAGKYLGEERLQDLAGKYGRWFAVSSKDVKKATSWFDRQGHKAVFFCSFVPGIRTFIAVPAGISDMALVQFVVYLAAGSLVWVGLLAAAGYFLGNNYRLVGDYLGLISGLVLGGVAIAFVIWVIKRKK